MMCIFLTDEIFLMPYRENYTFVGYEKNEKMVKLL